MTFDKTTLLTDRGFGIGWVRSFSQERIIRFYATFYKWHFSVDLW